MTDEEKAEIQQILFNELSEVAKEIYHGLSQAYLAVSEIDKRDGRGNVGIYRLTRAAKYFQWANGKIIDLAEKLKEAEHES